ncbi:protein MRG1-like [Pyrus x bretschneideri]|uniref:protein MRG1-like n=1 Tax=Pyrus x bretschneideri TaxID=225117 RepID=UPI00202E2291|nr:protein MRG1-like [Pyrus x bretschneideri]
MRRKDSKSKTAESHITDTDSSATESDSSAIKIDSDMIHDENYDASPPSPDSCPFTEGEKALAFHKARLYEAKVTDVRYKMDWEFYVHYAGWNKSRDEWARLDRLTKNTDKNKKKHQYLNQKQGTDKNAKLTHTAHTKPKSYHASRGKKRKNDSVCKDKGAIPMEDLVLQMPQTLKKQLVDDCEFITHLGKLVKLPRTPNVDDIFKKYLDYRSKDSKKKAQSVEEILKGLCCYFDKALPAMLLYKNERQQYEKAITDDVSPSSVYGAEHLLRPFVKLPELLLDANTEEETSKALQQKLVDFLKFSQTNPSAFFLSPYYVPDDIETSTNKTDV